MTSQSTVTQATAWNDPSTGTHTRLRGRSLMVARGLWFALFALTIVVLLVALPVFFKTSEIVFSPESPLPVQLKPEDALLMQRWGWSLRFYATYQTLTITIPSLVFLSIAVLLFWRRSDDRIVLFVSTWFVLLSSTGSPLLDPMVQVYPWWTLPVRFLQGACIGGFPIFTYLFPDGRFVPRWTRALAIAWAVWIVVSPFTPFAIANHSGVSALWFGVLAPGGIIIGLIAQAYRYTRVSSRVERQQTKWVLFGLSMVALGFTLYILIPSLVPSVTAPTFARILYLNFTETFLLVLPFCLFALCIVIAILRYQLWDIDHLINRTLVYGTLSAGVVGLNVVLIGSLGAIFQASGSLVITLLATSIVSLLIQPLRARLQRAINRLMYGERDDPYAVLSRLSKQLRTTLVPTAVLPTIVESVAHALKLPYVALALARDDRIEIVATYGQPSVDPLQLPLVYQSETIGQLLVAPRAPGETFTSIERRLLDDIALQAGIAAHAVRLTADLQRSRERLVAAREEERRRLRRDLHDGLGPQLASLTLSIAAARELLRQDVDATDQLLRELSTHAQAAIADIRRVVYDLRPPALDDFGLVLALREQVTHYSHGRLQVTIDCPDRMPALPAAVEVAAYRIVQEALTNVLRHAEAHTCVVRLRLGDVLDIEVRDDGIGLPQDGQVGVGLRSMRERTDELGGSFVVGSVDGGGTVIQARLPLQLEKT